MRAYSFRAALDAGLEPREYSDEVPIGTFKAHLDFKIWGESPCLRCFFSNTDGKKISISAYRAKDNPAWYSPKDGSLDMSAPDAAGNFYIITTGINSKGKTAWLTARKLSN